MRQQYADVLDNATHWVRVPYRPGIDLAIELCLSNISYLLLVIVFVYKRGPLINTVRTSTLFGIPEPV